MLPSVSVGADADMDADVASVAADADADMDVDVDVVNEPASMAEEDIPATVLFKHPCSLDVEEIPWICVSAFLILCTRS